MNEQVRWVAILVSVLVVLISWIWTSLNRIESRLEKKHQFLLQQLQTKADKIEARDRWTGSQMREYKEGEEKWKIEHMRFLQQALDDCRRIDE